VEDIYARMTARAKDQPAREGLFPGTGLGLVLPEVPTDSFASLAEALDATPKGEETLAKLADDLILEVDELFPIADTLQLIRFAELEGNRMRLTAAGRRSSAISAGFWTKGRSTRLPRVDSATNSRTT
jgi:NitT/TauT family transport system ATP-binding protein